MIGFAAAIIGIDANAVKAFLTGLAGWHTEIARIKAGIGRGAFGRADANLHFVASLCGVIGRRRIAGFTFGLDVFADAVDADLIFCAFGNADIGDDADLVDADGLGIVA